MPFKLVAPFSPSGDQPSAIDQLTDGLLRGDRRQTLLGVTGSGKTYTIANVIERVQRPTLVIAHNKTLAAQLCNEFREFFPTNAVEYFVSYYDYYQPEAYLPHSDTYIEKEAMINEEIDRLRHAATQSLLTRQDVIVVASVSAIYGLGAPETYRETLLEVRVGAPYERTDFMRRLLAMQFKRTSADLLRGSFRSRGDIFEVMPVNEETIYRIVFGAGKISELVELNPVTRALIRTPDNLWLYPAKHFVTRAPERENAIQAIRAELKTRLKEFSASGKLLEAERLERRTNEDLAMIRELGYCGGIENYSRHLSGRTPGLKPDTLLSYFPKDFLTVIDESHVTLSQIAGMYAGDASRKKTLIEYGFRLPSAADNRPLTIQEFEASVHQIIFVSATPGDVELKTSARVAEQIVRPTGLIDPEVIILPIKRATGSASQIDDFIERAGERIALGDRVLVTTLTKKMAEDLSEFLNERKIRVKYIHSDVETLDRIEIISAFRRGEFDILVGVNLLREGLDLPEVSLVVVFDADKEGFLRSETSLIQTMGRAARNIRGTVLLFADEVTGSMRRAIEETNRRRSKQIAYNLEHGITPRSIEKKIQDIAGSLRLEKKTASALRLELVADKRGFETIIKEKEVEMRRAAKHLEFELAALLRDEISLLAKEQRKKASRPGKSKTSSISAES